MNFSDFFNNLKLSFNDFIKNPFLILPTLILMFLLILLSKMSVFANHTLANTSSFILTSVFSFYSLIVLLIVSFFTSMLIYFSGEAINKRFGKSSLSSFFKKSIKFWIGNFIIIILGIALLDLSIFLSTRVAAFLGHSFDFTGDQALWLFKSIFLLCMLLIAFLAYSSFAFILEDSSIWKGIRKSIRIVKKNYISTLILIALFYLIGILIDMLGTKTNPIISSIIYSAIISPYFAIVFSRIVLNNKENKTK